MASDQLYPVGKRKPTLAIVQQIEPPTTSPFRLVETFETVDGVRTRMTHRTYPTLEEAQFMVKHLRGDDNDLSTT